MTPLFAQLRQALDLPRFDPAAAQRAMVPSRRTLAPPPADARLGAVMLLVYPLAGVLHTVLARRPDSLRDHPGQVALPGGAHEPGESLAETALRETEEELGVPPEQIELVGLLRPVYIPPSNFFVHPFVGWHSSHPPFAPHAGEVAEVIETSLAHFQDEANQDEEERLFEGTRYRIPFYTLGHHKVWGATATILAEMAARLSAVERQVHAE